MRPRQATPRHSQRGRRAWLWLTTPARTGSGFSRRVRHSASPQSCSWPASCAVGCSSPDGSFRRAGGPPRRRSPLRQPTVRKRNPHRIRGRIRGRGRHSTRWILMSHVPSTRPSSSGARIFSTCRSASATSTSLSQFHNRRIPTGPRPLLSTSSGRKSASGTGTPRLRRSLSRRAAVLCRRRRLSRRLPLRPRRRRRPVAPTRTSAGRR